METKLPAADDQAGLVVATSDHGADEGTAQAGPIGQNITVALLPLAIISLLIISFVAAAWTFLAALAHA